MSDQTVAFWNCSNAYDLACRTLHASYGLTLARPHLPQVHNTLATYLYDPPVVEVAISSRSPESIARQTAESMHGCMDVWRTGWQPKAVRRCQSKLGQWKPQDCQYDVSQLLLLLLLLLLEVAAMRLSLLQVFWFLLAFWFFFYVCSFNLVPGTSESNLHQERPSSSQKTHLKLAFAGSVLLWLWCLFIYIYTCSTCLYTVYMCIHIQHNLYMHRYTEHCRNHPFMRELPEY